MKQSDRAIELLETSGLQLRNLLYRMTLNEDVVDDLMQELFLRLAGSHGFGVSRNPFAYAWRVAVNLVVDHHRRKRDMNRLDERGMVCPEAVEPMDALVADEHIQIIMNEIFQMKPPGRDVLLLRFVEQRTNSEIAGMLEMKENYVRTVLSRALATLRGNLNGKLNIE